MGLNQTTDDWLAIEPHALGRLIFERIPAEARPRWAANLLKLAIKRNNIKAASIEHILNIADHSEKWGSAHEAFTEARRELLKLQKSWFKTSKKKILLKHLGLAELVAKITYNAINPQDPFDENAGWWIASNVKNIVDLTNNKEFSKEMWMALNSHFSGETC